MTFDRFTILNGDAVEMLKTLTDESVDCVVTSPPYYALRDYGVDGQIGLEHTPEEYIERLCLVFDEIHRVLTDNGTVWVNLGDSYWGSGSRGYDFTGKFSDKSKIQNDNGNGKYNLSRVPSLHGTTNGIKNKDLIGIPWMFAFAMRDRGWYLRQDIIWAKTNCMPESVTDRCTKSHEYIFLLTKQSHYYYDSNAIAVDCSNDSEIRYKYEFNNNEKRHGAGRPNGAINTPGMKKFTGKANKRDVWMCHGSSGYCDDAGSHYATYSTKLIEPCVLAGCPVGGVVMDPFSGSGTTGVCALQNERNYIGIELNPQYAELSRVRLDRETRQNTLGLEGDE